ncbi:putative E3 ubiquitin-protein ligase ARI2 [Sesamum angolense]|uniref:RBR-type E3 ubiquitin transferase n=1 Tax=Sesamum angolense TaxID=2727404 RepID=A0AAE2BMB9_9LAMI|nr:putative E3 ubiquitin-protein ligase ARI2 [Sesamum angolense]
MEDNSGHWSSDDDFYDRAYDDVECESQERDDESETSWSNAESVSCKVIRKESLLAAQKHDLQRMMELLSLKEHHARSVLIHYRWDVDKVSTVFVEKGKERLYAEAGVSVVDSNNLRLDGVFILKINEGQSRRITCMAHKCYSICDEGNIRNLVSARDPQLAEKFDRFLLESYIEDNKLVKWCPSVPHCGNAVRVENDEYCEVECVCGLQFCFSCSSEAHSPCSCLMWELWVRKCKDQSGAIDWITKNTRSCPKCHKSVLKNGGCNLVKCICGQPFCWLCGAVSGKENTHSTGHQCGRYKIEHREETEPALKELSRYTHYYNHYKAHVDSLKDEEKLKEKLEQKMATLESRELETKDFSWVSNGFYRLTRLRKILLHSYAFAYFMFGDELFKDEMSSQEKTIKQNLFEDQQQQLETNVERLSMFLEEQFAKYPKNRILELRTKVITLSAVTDKLCKKLYDCIENELLGPLQQATHIIAPYRSKGVERASELPAKPEATKDEEGTNYEGH